jgi:hypothetical protein
MNVFEKEVRADAERAALGQHCAVVAAPQFKGGAVRGKVFVDQGQKCFFGLYAH